MDISEESEFILRPLDSLDDLWPLYEGILEQQAVNGDRPNTTNDPLLMAGTVDDGYNKEIDISSYNVTTEQQHMETQPQVPLDNGMKKMKKISNISSNSKKRKEIIRRNSAIIIENKGKGGMLDGEGGQYSSSSVAKKMDHNAKERIRRMKVNAAFLALRALLPDSRRSKKRWSAPSIVDKVLKYIPELENEIEDLAHEKEQVQSAANKNKSNNITIENPTTSRYQSSTPTVSINEVNQDEAIVQICMDEKEEGSAFTDLLQRVDDEGICVNSASTLYVCENRTTSHLHIQMNSGGAEYIAELKDKFISWLR